MVKNFELTTLVKGSLSLEESNKIFEDLKELIKNLEGVITNEKIWGTRKLTYPIAKQEQAYFYTVNFDLDTAKSKNLNKPILLNQEIIRHLLTISYKKVGTIDFESEKQRVARSKETKAAEAPANTKEQEKKLEEALEKILEE